MKCVTEAYGESNVTTPDGVAEIRRRGTIVRRERERSPLYFDRFANIDAPPQARSSHLVGVALSQSLWVAVSVL